MKKSIRLFEKKILLSAFATSFISVFSGTPSTPKATTIYRTGSGNGTNLTPLI